jgi:hypothetical protein
MISGNPLRAAQLFCLAWSDFPTGGGAPGLSSDVLLHPCLHHVIVMNSETATCVLSQHACTADHNMPSLHQLALPCPSCISYSLHTHNLLLYMLSSDTAVSDLPTHPECVLLLEIHRYFRSTVSYYKCQSIHTTTWMHSALPFVISRQYVNTCKNTRTL